MRAYRAAEPEQLADRRTRWVMDLAHYKRIRAATCTEDQELARARAHATALIDAMASPPHFCPACGAGPFAAVDGLTGHMATMADPANREPAVGDLLRAIPIDVRADGGEPHLETPSVYVPNMDDPGTYLTMTESEFAGWSQQHGVRWEKQAAEPLLPPHQPHCPARTEPLSPCECEPPERYGDDDGP